MVLRQIKKELVISKPSPPLVILLCQFRLQLETGKVTGIAETCWWVHLLHKPGITRCWILSRGWLDQWSHRSLTMLWTSCHLCTAACVIFYLQPSGTACRQASGQTCCLRHREPIPLEERAKEADVDKGSLCVVGVRVDKLNVECNSQTAWIEQARRVSTVGSWYTKNGSRCSDEWRGVRV